MKKTNRPETPTAAYAAHAEHTFELLKRVEAGIIDCTTASWDHVGTIGHVNELLVEAAHALGQVTTEEAKTKYGVRL